MRRLLLALLLCLGAGQAHAGFTVASCGALPVTLTNGTLADATQVMQDFNALLSCINTSGTTSSVQVSGPGGGTVTIQNPSATVSYNDNLPATAGTTGQLLTSGGGGSNPNTWTSIPTAQLLGGAGASGFVSISVGTGLQLVANVLSATGSCGGLTAGFVFYSNGTGCTGDANHVWSATNQQLTLTGKPVFPTSELGAAIFIAGDANALGAASFRQSTTNGRAFVGHIDNGTKSGGYIGSTCDTGLSCTSGAEPLYLAFNGGQVTVNMDLGPQQVAGVVAAEFAVKGSGANTFIDGWFSSGQSPVGGVLQTAGGNSMLALCNQANAHCGDATALEVVHLSADTNALSWVRSGDFVVAKTTALASTATVGFLGLPVTTAANTGVPANTSAGVVLCSYNSTSHKLNCYDPAAASWYNVALVAGAG